MIDETQNTLFSLAFPLGKDNAGSPVACDLAKVGSLRITGAPGAGSTACIRAAVLSLISCSDPADVRMVLICPGSDDLQCCDGVPHLITPVIQSRCNAVRALSVMSRIMRERFRIFAETNAMDLDSYNRRVLQIGEKMMPRIVIFIHNADILIAERMKIMEICLGRLARGASAAGIHLIVSAQDSTENVTRCMDQANFPARVIFPADGSGAEHPSGIMLYSSPGCSEPVRVHGLFPGTEEIRRIAKDACETYHGSKGGRKMKIMDDPTYRSVVGNIRSVLQPVDELGLEYLNVRLLEKSTDHYVTFDEDGREISLPVSAEFLDYDTKKRYLLLEGSSMRDVVQVNLEYYVEHSVQEKAKVVDSLVSRIPYHELMDLTQFRMDRKEVLTSVIQPAWMPAGELRYPDVDESGRFMFRIGSRDGSDLWWRVILRNGNKALCLCDKGLFSDTFMEDDGGEDFSWEESRIRQLLNDEFYDSAFSAEEKKHIMEVRTETGTWTDFPVFDRVFLLSAAEVNCLLPSRMDRMISGTPDNVSLSRYPGIGDWWWTRSRGLRRERFCCVSPDGEIDRQGAWGRSDVCAVRPAILVDLAGSGFEVMERMV